jgi:hypothetical protein
VGERNRDRQLRDARLAYVSAVRRLDHALQRFDNSGIPMDPGPQPEPLPWTPEHRTIIRSVAFAFREVIERREEWDGLRRDFWSPH